MSLRQKELSCVSHIVLALDQRAMSHCDRYRPFVTATPCGDGGYAGSKHHCPSRVWLLCLYPKENSQEVCYGLGDRDDCEYGRPELWIKLIFHHFCLPIVGECLLSAFQVCGQGPSTTHLAPSAYGANRGRCSALCAVPFRGQKRLNGYRMVYGYSEMATQKRSRLDGSSFSRTVTFICAPLISLPRY